MDPRRTLYTRQQIGVLTELDDTTLNYWSREGLLAPTEGGGGRGSHRRFDYVQVNIAAILGAMRRFRPSITVMRSFAALLQEGVRLFGGETLHLSNITRAAYLASKLHEFRAGTPVMVSLHDLEEPRPANLHGGAYADWLRAKRPAASEEEIIKDLLTNRDYDSDEAILSVAERVGPAKETIGGLYADLVCDIVEPGYSDAYSWLVGFTGDDEIRVERGSGATFFEQLDAHSPEEFGPGIFLPVSGIIRRIWRLKGQHELQRERETRRREREAEKLRDGLAGMGIEAVVRLSDQEEDGFIIHALGTESRDVEAALDKLGYRTPSHQPDETPEAHITEARS